MRGGVLALIWSQIHLEKGQPEVAFTDSGYGSVPPLSSSDQPPPPESGDRGDPTGDDDNRTVISAATAVVSSAAQQSIVEVCNNIYSKIQSHVNEKNRDSFLETLPELLKAFAIKLAYSDPKAINRQTMHFIYDRHK